MTRPLSPSPPALLPRLSVLLAALALLVSACGSDDNPPPGPPPGSEADYHGVGAICDNNKDCKEQGQVCITDFAGGYCGIKDCKHNADCPDGSGCVTLGGHNYCFLFCVEKVDCNRNRPADLEANCSSSVDYVDGKKGKKACVPPSGS